MAKKKSTEKHNNGGKKEAQVAYQNSMLKKEIEELKSKLQTSEESKKLAPNITVKLEDYGKKEELEFQKTLMNGQLNIHQMKEMGNTLVSIINAEKERSVAIIDAESNSSSSMIEKTKEKRRSAFSLIVLIFGILLVVGSAYTNISWGYAIGGFFLIFVGIAPAIEPTDIDKVERLNKAFQGLPSMKSSFFKDLPSDLDNKDNLKQIEEKSET